MQSWETSGKTICFREQQVCYEIARILLKRFPGMANDIYLGDEQFG